MATVDEKQRNELIQKALESIKTEPSEQARQLCREIVETISNACQKNQKIIAEELQVLAKAVESSLGNQQAFEFKQKATAMMLEINMEERRKAKIHGQEDQAAPAHPEPAPVSQPAPVTQPEPSPQPQAPVESTPVPAQPVAAPEPTPSPMPAPSPAMAPAQAHNPGQSAQIPPQPVAEAQQNHQEQAKAPGDPPRSKIIGLPSQTSVPAQPGSSSSSSFFSSKMIGVATGAPQAPAAEPVNDTTNNTSDAEAPEAMPGVDPAAPVQVEAALPFKNLAYLYIGSDNFEDTVSYYLDVLKAEQVWTFDRFGSKVTAVRLSAGPLILISDHRKAPSCQPVFEVDDLKSCARELKERGWKEQAGPFGTPNGEAYSFSDPSGNSIAIFQVDPDSTDRSYVDPTEY